MAACPAPAVLVEFVEGRLAPGETASVQQHLLQCLGCRAAVASRDTRSGTAPAAAEDQDGILAALPLLAMGARVGPYRVTRHIGEGGMGAVFAAENEQLQRVVAIKVLYPEHSLNRQTLGRFFNEARAVNIVKHPGLVNVYEVGYLDSGSAYLIMEYLEGEPLSARLSRGLSGLQCLRLFRQVASALAAAHDKGVIHRDLKPGNVMVTSDPEAPGGERAKVFDFGIAKLTQQHLQGGDTGMKTRTGVTMGTPTYMSPEQVRAQEVSGKADVYSLGIMLYECLTGAPPFRGKSVVEIMAMHVNLPIPPLPQGPEAAPPGELAALLYTMLAKDPAARPSMGEVAAALGRLEQSGRTSVPAPVPEAVPQPSRSRSRLVLALGCLLLVTLAGLAGLAGLSRRQKARPPQPPPAVVVAPPAPPAVIKESPTLDPRPPLPLAGVGGVRESAAPAQPKITKKATRPAPPPAAAPAPQPPPSEEWTDGKIRIFK